MARDLFVFQYFTCWYYATIAFSVDDINMRTTKQIIFICFIYVVNTFAYSYILGVLIETLYNLRKSEHKVEEAIDDCNMALQHNEIHKMKDSIRDYFNHNYSLKMSQE